MGANLQGQSRHELGRPVVVKGTKLMVIWMAFAFLASRGFFAGAVSRPGSGTLWVAGVLWGATCVLAGLRVWIRRRVARAVRGHEAAALKASPPLQGQVSVD